jgi:hypothetical protein
MKTTMFCSVSYYPCCGSLSLVLPDICTCLQLHFLIGNIRICRPMLDVKLQRINLENICLPNKARCGRILSKFEIVQLKKMLIMSHFMVEVWNYVNPPPKVRITFLWENLSRIMQGSGTHPCIKCDRTAHHSFQQTFRITLSDSSASGTMPHRWFAYRIKYLFTQKYKMAH